VGPAGATGTQGPIGATGPIGEIGYVGSQGIPGTPGGATGPIGYTGSQGSFGYTGSQGLPGTGGSNGYTGSSATISVGLLDSSNQLGNVVTKINTIQFDQESGFSVTDLGSGAVRISGGGGGTTANVSSFRYWEVESQNTLVASGSDTVKFIAGSGVKIETDTTTSPQTIIISAPRLTVNLDCGTPTRTYGVDAYYDGGEPTSVYGGITPLDAGGVDF
jgi:hypothetical protein